MEHTLSRRGILQGGVGLAASALAGCMAFDGGTSMGPANPVNAGASLGGNITPALDPEQYADRFDNVVNIVDDYGADKTGEESITSALSRAWEDDTLIVFPQGQYKMNRRLRRVGSENVGLIGQNAVIRHGIVESIDGHVVTEGEYSGSTVMFKLGIPSDPHQGDLVFGGFIFDWGWHEDAGMQGLSAMVDGRLEVRNIVFNGLHSLGTNGNLRTATMTPESRGIVDSVSMREGGLHYIDTINTRKTYNYDGSSNERDGEKFGQSWSTTGITGHPNMRGTMVYSNILCGPWPDNGIYVQGGGGRKIIRNSISTNSGTSNIRIDGRDDWVPVPEIDENEDGELTRDGPYGQSTVENCTVIVDRKPSGVYQASRGIWLRGGQSAVRGCDIALSIADGSGAGGGYAIGASSGAAEVTIENVRIQLLEPSNAIYISTEGEVDLRRIEILTEGWDPSGTGSVFGGVRPPLEQVSLNGELL